MEDEDLPDTGTDAGRAQYLRDLAERLMRVPVVHGVDGWDIDTVSELARYFEARVAESASETTP